MDNLDKKVILTKSFSLKVKQKCTQYESFHQLPNIPNKQIKFLNTTSNVLTGFYFSTNSDQYVSCLNGSVLFLIIDLDPHSATYLKYEHINLSSDNPCYIFLPRLHGYAFYSYQNSVLFFSENSNNKLLGLQLLDEWLNIQFPISNYKISEADRQNLTLKDIKTLLKEHKINEEYSKILKKSVNGLNGKGQFDKTVLITGGAGFIGSHVAILLTKKYPNYNVIVLDKLEECSNFKNLNEIKDMKNFQFRKVDICDFEALKQEFEKYHFDYILHFAAETHVDISLVYPLKFTKTNVLGTHNLLECSRMFGVEKFVHVSTDEVYGTTDKIPNINQPLEPTNPYACSKLAAENIIKAYQKCYKMPIIITRGNNAYGPHQYMEKVIPKFITRLLKNKKCTIYENCNNAERDFLYVTDMAEAFDIVLHKGVVDEFYNIGSSKSVNILELAKKLIVLMGKAKEGEEDEYIEEVKGRILNDERYRIDSSRLIELGWKQNVEFDVGLNLTIDWYKKNQDYWENSDTVIDLYYDKI